MSDKPRLLARVNAKVRALLPEHWHGETGKLFRTTIDSISEYSKKNVRIAERLEEAPELGWNSLKVKSSEALLNAAEEENKRIATDLARQTLTDKARQEKAAADRMETEARISKIKELEERLMLVEKLRGANSVPVWDAKGNMAGSQSTARLRLGRTDKTVVTSSRPFITGGQVKFGRVRPWRSDRHCKVEWNFRLSSSDPP